MYNKYVFSIHIQVWFQNRRAKFRRNERNMLAQRSSLYGRPSLEAPSSGLEQPVAPRPTAINPEYLSWSTSPYGGPISNPAGAYNSVANNMSPAAAAASSAVSSCAFAGQAAYPNTPSVGNSIASLRLKAREYNMQSHYPMHHQMA